MIEKIIQITGFFSAGLLVSVIINTLLLHFSRTLGIRNKNDIVVRWSNESKPSLGGVSFYVVFVFAAIAFSVVFDQENIFKNKQFVGLFAAASLAFLMGLADDAYNTKPLIKLFVQLACGIIFIRTDTIIELFPFAWANYALTVLWVAGMMNSLNMLDNMDGITGTTVVSILLSCLIGSWLLFSFNTNIWTLILIAVIGSVVGFLFLNVHPSRLFMGDAGSQFIGLFAAFFGIKFLWNAGFETNTSHWTGIILVLTAFTPTLADTLTVTINRLKAGKSPMVGGKDHTTHHLVYAGFKDKQVWYVFLIIGLFSFLLTTAMVNMIRLKVVLPVAFFSFYFVLIFALLYRNTIKFPPKKH